MRQLILHIGNHKTGTTAIQLWLEQNASLLAKRGIACLTSPGAAHAHDYLAYIDDTQIFPKGYRLADRQRLTRDLQALKGDKIVMSSENFAFFCEPWAIQELADTVLPLFDEVRIICYLRRQDRHAVSHHAEGARPGRAPEWELWGHGLTVLPKMNAVQAQYLDYNARLEKWEKAFGRAALVVRCYERDLLVNRDSVEDFCDAAGIDMSGCTTPEVHNPSLGRTKIRIGHLLNLMTPAEAEAAEIMFSLPMTDGPAKPAAHVAKSFVDRYRKSNRELNERLKISALPTLFDEDFSDLPAHPPSSWTDAEYNTSIEALLRLCLRLLRRPVPKQIQHSASVDDLREAARAVAEATPARALRLIEAALLQRPDGPELLALQDQLKARVTKKI